MKQMFIRSCVDTVCAHRGECLMHKDCDFLEYHDFIPTLRMTSKIAVSCASFQKEEE